MSDDGRSLIAQRAATYAWEHLKFSAQQRQTVFRYYLVIIAALLAAYFLSFQSTVSGLAVMRPWMGGMLVIVSLLFWALDVRSHRLIKISEEYLRVDEANLATALKEPKIRLIQRSEDCKPTEWYLVPFASFRLIYGWIFAVVGAAGLLIVVFGPSR